MLKYQSNATDWLKSQPRMLGIAIFIVIANIAYVYFHSIVLDVYAIHVGSHTVSI